MKRIFALLIAILVVFSVGATAFAAPGAFIESPSEYDGPRLISVFHSDAVWKANLIVTSYSDRDELTEDEKSDLEKAYKDIVNASDLSVLAPEIEKKTETPVANLAASELFYIHEEPKQNAKGTYTITLDCETLSAYQALLMYKDGKWSIVEGAKLDGDGNLTFVTEALGAFAVVLNTEKVPYTGDNNAVIISFVIMAFAAAGLAATLMSKKKTAKV